MDKLDLVSSENKYNLLSGRVPLLLNRFLLQQFKNKGVNLTREQWSVLAVLWKTDGCSQQVIANSTSRDKPSVTRLVDNLVKDGYVNRKNHENDRRLNLIFLTEKGKKVEKDVMEIVDDTIEKATNGLSDDQIVAIRDAFQVVYDNLNAYIK
jgi:DNA-binding MarR family transcriptional regulator